MAAFVMGLLNILLVVCSIFLICLVLIQRGKGGGLAGAFGGMGGSSAFGSKTGDVFTKVTMVTASIWIGMSMILVILHNRGRASAFDIPGASAKEKPITDSKGKAKSGTTTGADTSTGSTTPANPAPPPTGAGTDSAPSLPPVFPDEPTKTPGGKTP